MNAYKFSTVRWLSRDIKRFYKDVSLAQSSHFNFEILLDRRKLKTPLGHVVSVKNEALAQAVANEWRSQNKVIKRHDMHLTSFMYEVIDNALKQTKDDLVNSIISYLSTDTVCCRVTDPENFLVIQNDNWDPILKWFNEEFMCSIPAHYEIIAPEISLNSLSNFKAQLLNYNREGLVALLAMTKSLKSCIIALALSRRVVNVDEAVRLSRLEENFQTEKWGKTMPSAHSHRNLMHIRYSDMKKDMRTDAIDLCTFACEKYSGSNEVAAKVIKEGMDRRFGPSWHVVVGEGFGMDVSHDEDYLLYIIIKNVIGICVWRSGA